MTTSGSKRGSRLSGGRSKGMAKSSTLRGKTSSTVNEQQQLLRELRDLLTSFAPAWYTQEMDNRLVAAIGKSSRSLERGKATAGK